MTKKKILYISLPDRLSSQIEGFPLDTSIPLPVEIPEEERDSWDISRLEWPALISGMLYVLAKEPEGREADYYRKLVKTVRPDIVSTVLTAARLKVDQEQFSFAEELFLTLCALEPEEKTHRSNLALFYRTREDHRLKGNETYSRALENIRKKNWDEGIAQIRSFLESHEDSSNGWFLLGWALRQNEKWDEALSAFTNAKVSAPPTVELLNEMALCESERGEWDQALACLDEGLEMEEENTTLLSNKAMVYLRMNDLSRAEDTLNRLREIDPEDPLLNYLD